MKEVPISNDLVDQVKSLELVAIVDVGFFGVVVAVTLLALHGSLRLTAVGLLCTGMTIGMYASPLSVMVCSPCPLVLSCPVLTFF